MYRSDGAAREIGFCVGGVGAVFSERDAANMVEMAQIYDGDREWYVSTARQHIQNWENQLRAEAAGR